MISSERSGCKWIDQDLWFHIRKSMWSKQCSFSNYYMNYINNDIQKPYNAGILHYSNSIGGLHDLSHFLPSPIKKFCSIMRNNVNSGTSSALIMRSIWQPGTSSHLSWRMILITNIMNVLISLISNGMASFPPWISIMLVKGLLPWLRKYISRFVWTNILTVRVSLGSPTRIIRIGLAKIRPTKPLSNI